MCLIPANKSDYELAQRAAQGDEESFNEIYLANKQVVYSLCLKMTKSPEQAEDMAQNTFLEIFRKIKTYKGNSRLSTWIYRLTVNEVLMSFQRKSHIVSSIDDEEKPIEPSYKITPELKILLDSCIDQLPEGYRKIFELKEIEGFEHLEIAALLGISEGTSKSQCHKARLKLQKLINRKANPKFFNFQLSSNEREKHAI